jgi:hypothetical protein
MTGENVKSISMPGIVLGAIRRVAAWIIGEQGHLDQLARMERLANGPSSR